MDTIKPIKSKNKLARTFQRVINLKTSTKLSSNNGLGICILSNNSDHDYSTTDHKKQGNNKSKTKQKEVLQALVAKLFASVTSIKAAYAELQLAQHPYNSDAIQVADQAVVDELKALSELKRSFLKKELNISPQVTLMLAEIQEQQSLMKTYEITITKIEAEAEKKKTEADSIKKRLDDSLAFNKSLEKKLNASGSLSMFENIEIATVSCGHFVKFVYYALRSVRSFVKLMVREMELARWDIDAAAKTIEPGAIFAKPSHRCFAFESYVSKSMLESFEKPNFSLQIDSQGNKPNRRDLYFNRFKNLKSVNSNHYLTQNPTSSFAKFTRAKYLNLVHAKMECSFFGNLNLRKQLTSGVSPSDSAFFTAFAEMSRRVWLSHCLAFSLHEEVSVFQVKRGCRFSEVYMENVADESLFTGDSVDSGADIRVDFTVVPGFKIGKNVIQSQVYLSPVSR